MGKRKSQGGEQEPVAKKNKRQAKQADEEVATAQEKTKIQPAGLEIPEKDLQTVEAIVQMVTKQYKPLARTLLIAKEEAFVAMQQTVKEARRHAKEAHRYAMLLEDNLKQAKAK